MLKLLEWSPSSQFSAVREAIVTRRQVLIEATTRLRDVASILVLYGLKTLSALTQIFPLNTSYRVAVTAADLVFLAWRSGRRDTMTNLRHVLGPEAPTEQVRAVSRQALRNYFKTLVEFLALRRLTSNEMMARLQGVYGEEYLEQSLSRGRGVILVGVHHGSWDVAAVIATNRGIPLSAVADTYHYRPLDEWVFAGRKARGVNIIPANEPRSLRDVFKILKRNEVLALVIDRPMNGDGIPVRFFDADLSFPQGAAAIALRTGATILPGYCIRQPDNTFVAELLPPVEYEPCGDRQKDIQRFTQAIVTRLEEIIRRHPEQWYAFQLLWDEDCQTMERVC